MALNKKESKTFKQDIHLGAATMISSVNDEVQEYAIEITAIHIALSRIQIPILYSPF